MEASLLHLIILLFNLSIIETKIQMNLPVSVPRTRWTSEPGAIQVRSRRHDFWTVRRAIQLHDLTGTRTTRTISGSLPAFKDRDDLRSGLQNSGPIKTNWWATLSLKQRRKIAECLADAQGLVHDRANTMYLQAKGGTAAEKQQITPNMRSNMCQLKPTF